MICASNLRQIGIGLTLYADANRDALPSTMFLRNDGKKGDGYKDDPSSWMPGETMLIRVPVMKDQDPIVGWDGLGKLFGNEFLPASEVFYCPSHWGKHPWKAYTTAFKAPKGLIVGNYQFRAMGPNGSRLLSRIEPSRSAIVTDGLRTKEDFNHKIGLNVLRADISLSWLTDGGRLWAFLPEDEEASMRSEDYEMIWEHIDHPDSDILDDPQS
ncbi:MAG: hypothetical protein KIS87_07780 [Phycisphaeraceae bacterium]|nr:hypothetical protein [Phycisphaeraceae bacterium]